jgi:hypothetical protein
MDEHVGMHGWRIGDVIGKIPSVGSVVDAADEVTQPI